MTSRDIISNRTFDELSIGDSASLTKVVTRDDVAFFGILSGDLNPTHFGALGALTAHSMWGGALISAVLGTKLPGPGTVYVSQSLNFHKRIAVGDSLTTSVTVREKNAARKSVTLDCKCVDAKGERVLSGTAEVIAPDEKYVGPIGDLPEVKFRRHKIYENVMARCRELAPVATAIAYPCSEPALSAVVEAEKAALIRPLLVGPETKIRALARQLRIAPLPYEIIDTADAQAAADKAVELVRARKADLLMKGSLHTDEILGAVVKKDTGLRTGRRISHCFIMDIPAYPKPLIITDAAVNIAPTLADKIDIVQNAVDLARALGLERPRVAVLSAVETVNPRMPSTLDAAALSKMADRGQITGAFVDGPMALDNAISSIAAEIKGIQSPVAGQADILVVPDIEAGNMVYKNLSLLADADGAGLVLGARAPVVLTSRADTVRTRLASCAVAALYIHARQAAEGGGEPP